MEGVYLCLKSKRNVQNTEQSDFQCVYEDVVKKLNDNMPPDEILYDLAELFKVFGDSTRVKILYALFESELCVGDMRSF